MAQPTPPPAPEVHPTLYDPEALADLLAERPQLARALLARLSPLQCRAQAIVQAWWLRAHGIPVTAGEVLASWE
jgi:hypothetical protein